MRKLLFAVIVLFCASLYNPNQGNAQIIMKLGAAYHTKAERIGLNFGVNFDLVNKESISFGLEPGVAVYWPEEKFTLTYGLYQINLNANVRFKFADEKIQLYPFIGPNLTYISVSGGNTQGLSSSEGKFGVNVGAGGLFFITDNFGLYGEVRYTTTFEAHLVPSAGIMWRLGGKD